MPRTYPSAVRPRPSRVFSSVIRKVRCGGVSPTKLLWCDEAARTASKPVPSQATHQQPQTAAVPAALNRAAGTELDRRWLRHGPDESSARRPPNRRIPRHLRLPLVRDRHLAAGEQDSAVRRDRSPPRSRCCRCRRTRPRRKASTPSGASSHSTRVARAEVGLLAAHGERGAVQLQGGARVAGLRLDAQLGPARRAAAASCRPRRSRTSGPSRGPRHRHPAAVAEAVLAGARGRTPGPGAPRRAGRRPRAGPAPRPGRGTRSRAAPASAGSPRGPGAGQSRSPAARIWVPRPAGLANRVACRITSWLDSTQVAGAPDRAHRVERVRSMTSRSSAASQSVLRYWKLKAWCSSSGRT